MVPTLMRTGRPSSTSSLVTLLRALAHGGVTEVRDFADPTALPMLTQPWRLWGQGILLGARLLPFARRQLVARASGRMDLIALRTKVFDEAWHAAHAAGTRQLVLLGAGLDGRAFRLDDLGDASVFEVDHPATQALKRERARGLTSPARQHLFVPVDFERQPLAQALEAAGLRKDQPAFFIWEGVTPYLSREAQRSTLSAVAALSAPGSRVAFTYVEPTHASQINRLVKVLGEPFIGLLTRAEAAGLLAAAGLRAVDDSGPEQWRARFSDAPKRPPGSFRERIAVGEAG